MSVETYEQIPYQSKPFPQATAERMAVVARLFGLCPVPPSRARVLEIGCAGAGNIIPRAAVHPGATFVGIDPGQRHIHEARHTADLLGLTNLTVSQRGVEDLTDADGPFDYIVCHGVFSWVSQDIRSRLLERCGALLSAEGVAYISYNTLPGWNTRQTLRDAMLFHSELFDEPSEKVGQARAMVEFLAECSPGSGGLWHRLLEAEVEALSDRPDDYIFHEHLSTNNDPVYVRDFIAAAAEAGLAYLGETDLAHMMSLGLPARVRSVIDAVSNSQARKQQYLDFLHNRAFRCSLLVPADKAVHGPLTWENTRGLWVASGLRPVDDPDAPERAVFEGAGGARLASDSPWLVAAWSILAERSGVPLAFEDWVAQTADRVGDPPNDIEEFLGTNLLYAHVQGLAWLWPEPIALDGHRAERPTAFPVAQLQSISGSDWATTRLHERYPLDALDHHLLALCTGSQTRDDMVAALATLAREGRVTVHDDANNPVGDELLEAAVRELLDDRLLLMGRRGLLDAGGAP